MTLRSTNMEPRLLMRDNAVPRVAKWVVLSDTLHSRLLSRSQWRRFIASRYSLRRGNVTAPCNLSAVKMRRREKGTEAKEEKEKKYESRGSIVNLTHFSERRRIKLPFVCLLFSHDSHLYSRSRGIRIFYSRWRYEAGESVIEIRVARKRGTRDEIWFFAQVQPREFRW